MDLWTCEKWKEYYKEKSYRKGIRVYFEKGTNEDVKNAIQNLLVWLRKNYVFPVRVSVYVKKESLITASDGDKVLDWFFVPGDRDDEPFVEFAVGDYQKLLKKRGKDNALMAILISFLRNLTHYFRWLNDIDLTERGKQSQATYYARRVFWEYAENLEHLQRGVYKRSKEVLKTAVSPTKIARYADKISNVKETVAKHLKDSARDAIESGLGRAAKYYFDHFELIKEAFS